MKKLSKLMLLLACATGGCSESPQHSLVGAWDIQPDVVLKAETTTLWFRKYGPADIHHTLSFTLEPDGVLKIEKGRDHTVCCFGGIDNHLVDATQKVRLSDSRQREIRRLLARLRPDHLGKEGPLSLPLGCNFVSDGGAWSGVAFQHGEAAGSFIFQSDCKGEGAKRVKDLLRVVLEKLPTVDGSSAFIAS